MSIIVNTLRNFALM